MNYLAHAYLSFNEPEILSGNMISDFVKGKKKFGFSLPIQHGIALHRAIDQFTDFHPATQEAKSYFKKDYRLYSGAFVDVVYDHFLANDKNEFSNEKDLDSFCQTTYINLQKNEAGLPEKFLQMLPYMKEQNWLFHYGSREGIEKSFGGLVRRALYLSESATAFSIFNKHYQELENCYQLFFPELKNFSAQYLAQLNNQ
jgi:acyl carrier protein phosphodiesterase